MSDQLFRVEHDAEFDADDMVFGFNPHHLMDGIQQLRESTFTMELWDPSTFAVMREEDEDTLFIYMIVPLSLR